MCNEELNSVGPATLSLEIKGHNTTFHPDMIASHTWTCPKCNEVISRAEPDALTLAIKGHNVFKHYKPEDVRSDDVPLDGRTQYDIDFLKEARIRW